MMYFEKLILPLVLIFANGSDGYPCDNWDIFNQTECEFQPMSFNHLETTEWILGNYTYEGNVWPMTDDVRKTGAAYGTELFRYLPVSLTYFPEEDVARGFALGVPTPGGASRKLKGLTNANIVDMIDKASFKGILPDSLSFVGTSMHFATFDTIIPMHITPYATFSLTTFGLYMNTIGEIHSFSYVPNQFTTFFDKVLCIDIRETCNRYDMCFSTGAEMSTICRGRYFKGTAFGDARVNQVTYLSPRPPGNYSEGCLDYHGGIWISTGKASTCRKIWYVELPLFQVNLAPRAVLKDNVMVVSPRSEIDISVSGRNYRVNNSLPDASQMTFAISGALFVPQPTTTRIGYEPYVIRNEAHSYYSVDRRSHLVGKPLNAFLFMKSRDYKLNVFVGGLVITVGAIVGGIILWGLTLLVWDIICIPFRKKCKYCRHRHYKYRFITQENLRYNDEPSCASGRCPYCEEYFPTDKDVHNRKMSNHALSRHVMWRHTIKRYCKFLYPIAWLCSGRYWRGGDHYKHTAHRMAILNQGLVDDLGEKVGLAPKHEQHHSTHQGMRHRSNAAHTPLFTKMALITLGLAILSGAEATNHRNVITFVDPKTMTEIVSCPESNDWRFPACDNDIITFEDGTPWVETDKDCKACCSVKGQTVCKTPKEWRDNVSTMRDDMKPEKSIEGLLKILLFVIVVNFLAYVAGRVIARSSTYTRVGAVLLMMFVAFGSAGITTTDASFQNCANSTNPHDCFFSLYRPDLFIDYMAAKYRPKQHGHPCKAEADCGANMECFKDQYDQKFCKKCQRKLNGKCVAPRNSLAYVEPYDCNTTYIGRRELIFNPCCTENAPQTLYCDGVDWYGIYMQNGVLICSDKKGKPHIPCTTDDTNRYVFSGRENVYFRCEYDEYTFMMDWSPMVRNEIYDCINDEWGTLPSVPVECTDSIEIDDYFESCTSTITTFEPTNTPSSTISISSSTEVSTVPTATPTIAPTTTTETSSQSPTTVGSTIGSSTTTETTTPVPTQTSTTTATTQASTTDEEISTTPGFDYCPNPFVTTKKYPCHQRGEPMLTREMILDIKRNNFSSAVMRGESGIHLLNNFPGCYNETHGDEEFLICPHDPLDSDSIVYESDRFRRYIATSLSRLYKPVIIPITVETCTPEYCTFITKFDDTLQAIVGQTYNFELVNHKENLTFTPITLGIVVHSVDVNIETQYVKTYMGSAYAKEVVVFDCSSKWYPPGAYPIFTNPPGGIPWNDKMGCCNRRKNWWEWGAKCINNYPNTGSIAFSVREYNEKHECDDAGWVPGDDPQTTISMTCLQPVKGESYLHEYEVIKLDYVADISFKCDVDGSEDRQNVTIGAGSYSFEACGGQAIMRVSDVALTEIGLTVGSNIFTVAKGDPIDVSRVTLNRPGINFLNYDTLGLMENAVTLCNHWCSKGVSGTMTSSGAFHYENLMANTVSIEQRLGFVPVSIVSSKVLNTVTKTLPNSKFNDPARSDMTWSWVEMMPTLKLTYSMPNHLKFDIDVAVTGRAGVIPEDPTGNCPPISCTLNGTAFYSSEAAILLTCDAKKAGFVTVSGSDAEIVILDKGFNAVAGSSLYKLRVTANTDKIEEYSIEASNVTIVCENALIIPDIDIPGGGGGTGPEDGENADGGGGGISGFFSDLFGFMFGIAKGIFGIGGFFGNLLSIAMWVVIFYCIYKGYSWFKDSKDKSDAKRAQKKTNNLLQSQTMAMGAAAAHATPYGMAATAIAPETVQRLETQLVKHSQD